MEPVLKLEEGMKGRSEGRPNWEVTMWKNRKQRNMRLKVPGEMAYPVPYYSKRIQLGLAGRTFRYLRPVVEEKNLRT